MARLGELGYVIGPLGGYGYYWPVRLGESGYVLAPTRESGYVTCRRSQHRCAGFKRTASGYENAWRFCLKLIKPYQRASCKYQVLHSSISGVCSMRPQVKPATRSERIDRLPRRVKQAFLCLSSRRFDRGFVRLLDRAASQLRASCANETRNFA